MVKLEIAMPGELRRVQATLRGKGIHFEEWIAFPEQCLLRRALLGGNDTRGNDGHQSY